ncbi:MAG: hypothetical protein WD929_06930 [Steroidobacteraceae bacterium]
MPLPRILTGCLCLITGCTGAPDLDSVIAKHVEARGGASAIEAIHSYEADIRIVEPTFEVDGNYVATRDGGMRIDISMDGTRVFTEALDQGRSWSWSPGEGVSEGSPQGSAALRHGIEFPFKLFGLHEMRARGHRLELQGREVVDGIDYHVLQLTLDDGFHVTYYVHPESWLIERERARRALHVDVDPTLEWIETVYSDYRPMGGVLYPYQQVERQLTTGKVLSTGTTREIRINPPLAADHFAPP